MLGAGTRNQVGDTVLRLAHVLHASCALADALTTIEQFLSDYPDSLTALSR